MLFLFNKNESCEILVSSLEMILMEVIFTTMVVINVPSIDFETFKNNMVCFYKNVSREEVWRSLQVLSIEITKKVQPIKINLQVVSSCPTEFCVILSRLRCARHPRLLKFLWRSLGLEGLGLTVTQCPTRHRTTQGLTSTIIDRPSRPFITDVMFQGEGIKES